jgi:hypothetical protein
MMHKRVDQLALELVFKQMADQRWRTPPLMQVE